MGWEVVALPPTAHLAWITPSACNSKKRGQNLQTKRHQTSEDPQHLWDRDVLKAGSTSTPYTMHRVPPTLGGCFTPCERGPPPVKHTHTHTIAGGAVSARLRFASRCAKKCKLLAGIEKKLAF